MLKYKHKCKSHTWVCSQQALPDKHFNTLRSGRTRRAWDPTSGYWAVARDINPPPSLVTLHDGGGRVCLEFWLNIESFGESPRRRADFPAFKYARMWPRYGIIDWLIIILNYVTMATLHALNKDWFMSRLYCHLGHI